MRIRAALQLGFFAVLGASGCSPAAHDALVRSADEKYRTDVFFWLATHQPDRLVAWDVAPAEIAGIVPGTRIFAASSEPCAQARNARAALLLVGGNAARRDLAENCGFALFHDPGALVIAPR